MNRRTTARSAVLLALVIGACERAHAPLDDVGVSRGEVSAPSTSTSTLAPIARVGHLGASTALYGNTLVIGAPRARDAAGTSGAVFIYERSTVDGTWALSATLWPPSPKEGDQFGGSVALSGDVLLVAAVGHDRILTDTGAVYVYSRNQGGTNAWGQVTELFDPNPSSAGLFGRAIAVSGDFAVATTGGSGGHGYVFARNQDGADAWGFVQELPTCSTQPSAVFGASAAIAGDVAVIGAPAAEGGAACVFARDATLGTWAAKKTLAGPDTIPGDLFGAAVAAATDLIAVGAPGRSDLASSAGAAYVFERNLGGADAWTQRTKILVGDAQANDAFGSQLALTTERLAVGVASADPVGTSSGATYVFDRNEGGINRWGQAGGARLVRPQGAAGELFGASVAASGTRVAIGATFANILAPESGGVTVFTRAAATPGAFSFEAEIASPVPLASDRQSGAAFGRTVAATSDIVVVGAPSYALTGFPGAGAAYAYVRDPSTSAGFLPRARLAASTPAQLAAFGTAAAVSGEVIAVGAPNAAAGAVYLYERNAGGTDQFGEIARLVAADGASGDRLGNAVALDADLLAVGAPSAGGKGRVYLFARDATSGTWSPLKSIDAADGAAGDDFGGALALAGDVLAVGAPGDDDSAPGSGAVYVFLRDQGGAGAWGQKVKLVPAAASNPNRFGAALAASATTLLVGEPGAAQGTLSESGAVHVFDRNRGGADAFQLTTRIANPIAASLAHFGDAVAIAGDLGTFGSPGSDANRGSVRLHARTTGGLDTWGSITSVFGDGTASSFGDAVATDGTVLVVGAPIQDTGAVTAAGSVHVFALTPVDGCTPNPCLNGASCTDTVGGFLCTCVPGFAGATCQTNIDECATAPCKNAGTCSDLVNAFSCACAPGWRGPTCEENIDECAPAPCKNGAACTDLVNGYSCACTVGWSGTTCEVNIDDCAAAPCKNGGTCTDLVNAFSCTCAPGWSGTTCTVNVNECAPAPCKNGGTCTDKVNGFTCACPTGWTGPTCEVDFDDCASAPCQNGGTCTDLFNAYSCTCPSNYWGSRCELPDRCAAMPCNNNGTCTNTVSGGVAGFTCSCAAGFAGTTCEININDCAPNPCQNGGTCFDRVNSYFCQCAPGYSGTNCSVNVNDCAPNPCMNGGACTDKVNDYSCICAAGWTGKNCTTNIDDCTPNPCKNGGTCTDGVSAFGCNCPTAWKGSVCTDDVNECTPPGLHDCAPNAICTNTIGGFTCECPPGFSGDGKTCVQTVGLLPDGGTADGGSGGTGGIGGCGCGQGPSGFEVLALAALGVALRPRRRKP